MLKGKRTGFLLLILLFSVCCHCPSQASIQQDSVTYNGHSYAVLAGYGAPTFYQAYEDCKNAGGHLVTISSAREEKVVRNLAKNGGANWYWIGLAKTGNTWSWVDGSKVKYTYWANNAPATKKNYAFMYGKSYRDSKKVKKAVGRWDSMSAYDPLFTSEEFYNENNGRILCEWDYVAGEAEPAITYEIEVGERKKIYTSKETDAGWSSTDTDVVTIVNQAMSYIEVSAVGEGSASITAKHGDEVYSIDFSVTLKQADAEIGGKKYKTLNQAFKKVKDGQTINLLHNVVLSGDKGITLSKDAAYVVNLNGYRISANKTQDILVKKGNVTFRNGETTSNIYLTVGVNATASLNKMACYNLENEGSIKILNSYIGELPPWSILNGICDLVEKKKSAEYSFGISVPL